MVRPKQRLLKENEVYGSKIKPHVTVVPQGLQEFDDNVKTFDDLSDEEMLNTFSIDEIDEMHRTLDAEPVHDVNDNTRSLHNYLADNQ